MAGVYTVTQINSYIKNMFRQDFVLNRIQIKGEISNCKYHTSGHIYFTLKDSGGTIAVVMFASYASKLDIKLENGMSVVVDGRIDIYERDGGISCMPLILPKVVWGIYIRSLNN